QTNKLPFVKIWNLDITQTVRIPNPDERCDADKTSEVCTDIGMGRKKLLMKLKLCFCTLLLLCLYHVKLSAQESNFFGRTSIGLELGSWKPNTLTDEATVSPFGVPSATPFLGLFILSPAIQSWIFRATFGFWAQNNIKSLAPIQSVTIYTFMLDLKNPLLPQSRLSPFVSYGATVYLGSENESQSSKAKLSKEKQTGYGANVGAGFEIMLGRHWVIGMEFCYHYALFRQVLGLTKDYSGPKITLAVYYSFGSSKSLKPYK
ncbi:MAG: hypothetical protein ONB05_06395, partial [candidate division KSB1 bacterium]|nr:hypothetical protein [candidate division KSB1 bacterium]